MAPRFRNSNLGKNYAVSIWTPALHLSSPQLTVMWSMTHKWKFEQTPGAKSEWFLTLPWHFFKGCFQLRWITIQRWQMERQLSAHLGAIRLSQVTDYHCTWVITLLIYFLIVESVEPGNDISLEGWTSCNVLSFFVCNTKILTNCCLDICYSHQRVL